MKTITYFIFFVPLLLCGCAAVRPASDVAAGAGGGALADYLSNGNPGITAAGTAGGVMVSEGLHYAAKTEAEKAYVNGYEKGRSDAVKQQYWILVNQQRTSPNQSGGIRYYEIQIPEQTIDGVNLEPTTKYIRIGE
jgi:hypothetical protein